MLLLVLQLVVTVLSSSARAGSTSNVTVSDFVTRSSEICQVSDDVLASLLSVFLFCLSFSLFQEKSSHSIGCTHQVQYICYPCYPSPPQKTPNAPVCTCPCASQLVTITHHLQGGQQCLEPKEAVDGSSLDPANDHSGRSRVQCKDLSQVFKKYSKQEGVSTKTTLYNQPDSYSTWPRRAGGRASWSIFPAYATGLGVWTIFCIVLLQPTTKILVPYSTSTSLLNFRFKMLLRVLLLVATFLVPPTQAGVTYNVTISGFVDRDEQTCQVSTPHTPSLSRINQSRTVSCHTPPPVLTPFLLFSVVPRCCCFLATLLSFCSPT